MHHHLLLFAGIDNDWISIIVAVVILVVVYVYVRSVGLERRRQGINNTEKPNPTNVRIIRYAQLLFIIIVAVWAYIKFRGH